MEKSLFLVGEVLRQAKPLEELQFFKDVEEGSEGTILPVFMAEMK